MKAILTCAVLALSAQLAVAADPAQQPHRLSRSAAGPHHTKASSYAPQGHSKAHVYGSPIQAPILHRRTPAKKKPVQAPARPSGAPPSK